MNDIDLILNYAQVKDHIGGFTSKPLIKLPYGLIKVEIPEIIKAGTLEEVAEAVLKHQHETFNIKDHSEADIMPFVLWVKNQIEHIANLEAKYLQSEAEAEMVASGIHLLDEFGALTTIDSLAGGDILKHEAIKALPYFVIYQKLKLDKIQNEIKKRHEKIIIEKSKRK